MIEYVIVINVFKVYMVAFTKHLWLQYNEGN